MATATRGRGQQQIGAAPCPGGVRVLSMRRPTTRLPRITKMTEMMMGSMAEKHAEPRGPSSPAHRSSTG